MEGGIRTLLALMLLLALIPPPFTARWDSATSATVQWTQRGRACLSVVHANGSGVAIGCFDKVGTITIQLGHAGPLDGAYRPIAGDVYILQADGLIARAPLIGRPQYLPAFR